MNLPARYRWLGRLLFVVCLLPGIGWAATPAVPGELEPWRAWVLEGYDYRKCPFLASEDQDLSDRDSFVCAWPGRLGLTVEGSGARFSQRWQVYADSWIALPGETDFWPREVTVNGVAAAVVARDEAPYLRLIPGTYTVSGEFRWTRRPESLSVSETTALIDLTIDGQRVAQPERPADSVWLGKRRSAEQQEQLEVQVYRRVEDQVPVRLTTLIRLQVAGDGREEVLARALPEGFEALSIDSALPVRIEPDGRLRVQARAGSWEITLTARGASEAQALRRPKAEGPWAKEEVWSFAGDDRLRVVAVEGVEGVDPVQTGVPDDWRQLPAYRMAADSEMRVTERSRGIAGGEENALQLQRTLWLDFDGGGYTAVDEIYGRMREGWRLDMQNPQRLLSATANSESLLVTKGNKPELTGVELRNGAVQLRGVSRIEQRGALSATGWLGRFDAAQGQLRLPPGHRLIAVSGADEAPSSWIKQWRLLDLFLVLVVAAAVARLFGWRFGVLALIALALVQHDTNGQAWLWLNLLVAVVLAREAPDGKLLRIARLYRVASFAVLLIALVPFAFQQFRLAVYPQLEGEVFALFDDSANLTMNMRRDAMAPPEVAMDMAVPAAPPPPKLEMPQSSPMEQDAVATESNAVDQIVVTGTRKQRASDRINSSLAGAGLNYSQVVQRYAPGTLVQTGPGIPGWNYSSHPYSWSGPVDAQQQVRFVVATPFWLGLWRILGCVLLAALLVVIGSSSFGNPRLPDWVSRWRVAAPLLLLALMPLHDVRAEVPNAQILNELKTRLTKAPDCSPNCADITHTRVRMAGNELDIVLEVSALELVAVPIPEAQNQWEPETISIDGQANGGLFRDSDGLRWIVVPRGVHQVRLTGRVASTQTVGLVFPMRPRTIDVSSDGWESAGVGDGRLLTDTLEFVRQRSATQSQQAESGREFPPFVRVHRNVILDLDWSVQTTVLRIAPEKGAFTLAVPLLPTESVLTEGIEVRPDRTALVAMPAGESTVQWTSGLPRAESLELQMPAKVARSEVWSFAVSPQWHVTFAGVPQVLPASVVQGPWTFEFHPRGGEKLTLQISRPAAAEGATLAIDNASMSLEVGKRSTQGTLSFNYRSTQGGRHALTLPADARVTAIRADGQPVSVRPTNGELTLGLLPGAHAVEIDWVRDVGAGFSTRAMPVDLRNPASNLTTQINVPRDRWVLFAFGTGVGPAILFWSELAVFLGLALLIGGSRHSPLKVHEWLLLGLGLSTFSWTVLLLFAAWAFLMHRQRDAVPDSVRWRFNVVQVGMAVLTVVALVSLVSAIPSGLLGSPDMRVGGPNSGPGSYYWFLDQTEGALPQPGIISVSIWWYRAAMLAWALWLSFALLRWLPWAWRIWTRNGVWRRREPLSGKQTSASGQSPAPSAGT